MGLAWRWVVGLGAMVWLGAASSASSQETAAQPRAAGAGDARAGLALFSGDVPFANRGPPCGSCHDITGLAFPGGGTLGPDLSQSYSTFGPDGTAVVLATLYFPTMSPVFAGRLLTPAEQRDLTALLVHTSQQPAQPDSDTAWVALLGLAAFAFFALLAFVAAMRRLKGVRAPLVERRTRRGASRA